MSSPPKMRDDNQNEPVERPSKSARKRAAQSLRELGETLLDMSAATLDELPLPDDLRDAVRAARRIRSHGAQLRQRQYIGKLLRKLDAESIRAALERRTELDKLKARRSLLDPRLRGNDD
jgi:ribosome-associated protein